MNQCNHCTQQRHPAPGMPCLPPREGPDCCNRCEPCPPCDGPWMLPRVIGVGRDRVRCLSERLNVSVPSCGQPPFTICAVQALTPCQMCEAPGCGCRSELLFDVTVPLELTLRDACGKIHRACSQLHARLRIPLCCRGGNVQIDQAFAQACVRLVSAPPFCGNWADVCLDLLLEAYVTRLEPYQPCRPDRPVCPPEIPWYPQPCYHERC